MQHPLKTRIRVPASWMVLYEAALQESDPGELPQRIADAEEAIAERGLMLLLTSGAQEEQQALSDAHLALAELKKNSRRAANSV